MSQNRGEESSSSEKERLRISRRKFLKWSAYVPPAVMTLLMTTEPAHAFTCNPDTCGPDSCNPGRNCNPNR